jgi:hypothetical protein
MAMPRRFSPASVAVRISPGQQVTIRPPFLHARSLRPSTTCIQDLLRYWIGHSNESITSGYSMVKADVAFRKKEAEELGLGFELSSEKPDLVPNVPICTQNVLMSQIA